MNQNSCVRQCTTPNLSAAFLSQRLPQLLDLRTARYNITACDEYRRQQSGSDHSFCSTISCTPNTRSMMKTNCSSLTLLHALISSYTLVNSSAPILPLLCSPAFANALLNCSRICRYDAFAAASAGCLFAPIAKDASSALRSTKPFVPLSFAKAFCTMFRRRSPTNKRENQVGSMSFNSTKHDVRAEQRSVDIARCRINVVINELGFLELVKLNNLCQRSFEIGALHARRTAKRLAELRHSRCACFAKRRAKI